MKYLTITVPLGPNYRPLASHTIELYQAVYLDQDGNEVSFTPPQADRSTAMFLVGSQLGRAQPAEVRKVTLKIKAKLGRMSAATPPECLEQVRHHHNVTLRRYPNPRQQMNRWHTKWLAEAERDFPHGVERLGEFRKRKPSRLRLHKVTA